MRARFATGRAKFIRCFQTGPWGGQWAQRAARKTHAVEGGIEHPRNYCTGRGRVWDHTPYKKVHEFPVSSRDVTYQTPPGQE